MCTTPAGLDYDQISENASFPPAFFTAPLLLLGANPPPKSKGSETAGVAAEEPQTLVDAPDIDGMENRSLLGCCCESKKSV